MQRGEVDGYPSICYSSLVATHPDLWIGLFSDNADVASLGASYLRIVGPVYACFGLGLGLFFVTQGMGRAVDAMNANAIRLIVSATGGLLAVYWLGLGTAGFFAAVAVGFCLYAALLVRAVLRVKLREPNSQEPPEQLRSGQHTAHGLTEVKGAL